MPAFSLMSFRQRFIGGMACVACLTSCAFAQASLESSDAILRADCRLAAQTLATGHPAPKSDWALALIPRCTDSGGPALRALWAAAPSDSVALEQLMTASARLLDARVYSGVLTAARDVGAPLPTRLAALRVLATYVNPSKVIYPDALAKPKADTAIIAIFVSSSHGPHQYIGAAPMPTAARDDIRELFWRLWHADPDPVVRRAGHALHANLF